MGYAELIRRLQVLPPAQQTEVFDFVDFLTARYQPAEWSDAEFSTMSIQQAMRGLEDEPTLYTSADLKEQWQ